MRQGGDHLGHLLDYVVGYDQGALTDGERQRMLAEREGYRRTCEGNEPGACLKASGSMAYFCSSL